MRGAKPSSIAPGTSPVVEPLDPPDWLSADARAEWSRVAPILIEERRTLTGADIGTLVSYCVAVGQVTETSRIIAAKGMFYESKTGPRKHPAVAIRSDAITQARLLASELGLTPVSRSRSSGRPAEGHSERGGLFDMEFR